MQPQPRASCGRWWYHGDIGTNIDFSCGRTWDADMILGSSLGLAVTMVPGDGKGHPDQYGTAAAVDPNTALEAAQPIGWHSVATGAMDPGGKLASNIFPLLSICFSSFMCLSTAHGPFCFSVSPIFPTPYFLKMTESTCLRIQADFLLTCGGFEGPSRPDLV